MTTLNFDQLTKANVERCEQAFHRRLDEWSPSDWGVAMAGELCEACDAITKLRKLNGMQGDAATAERARLVTEIGKELADVVTYADLLAASLGLKLGQCVVEKFNEVSRRVDSPIMLVPSPVPSPASPTPPETQDPIVIVREGGGFETCMWCGKPIDGERPVYWGFVKGTKILDLRHRDCQPTPATSTPTGQSSPEATVTPPGLILLRIIARDLGITSPIEGMVYYAREIRGAIALLKASSPSVAPVDVQALKAPIATPVDGETPQSSPPEPSTETPPSSRETPKASPDQSTEGWRVWKDGSGDAIHIQTGKTAFARDIPNAKWVDLGRQHDGDAQFYKRWGWTEITTTDKGRAEMDDPRRQIGGGK